MAVLVSLLAFLAGIALGAALAVWWLSRRPVAAPLLDAVPATRPAGEPAAAAGEPAAAAGDDDQELKPILDATRGVLTDLEERYRGRRSSKSDG